MSIITPSSNRLLVQPIEDKVDKVGDIYIPESAKRESSGTIRAKIISVGETKHGSPYRAGDTVVVQRFDVAPIHVDGKDYLLVSSSSVLATIKA